MLIRWSLYFHAHTQLCAALRWACAALRWACAGPVLGLCCACAGPALGLCCACGLGSTAVLDSWARSHRIVHILWSCFEPWPILRIRMPTPQWTAASVSHGKRHREPHLQEDVVRVEVTVADAVRVHVGHATRDAVQDGEDRQPARPHAVAENSVRERLLEAPAVAQLLRNPTAGLSHRHTVLYLRHRSHALTVTVTVTPHRHLGR